VRAYVALFLPLLAAAVIDQAVLFTDRAMASTLTPGAVSALYYASLLWGMPVVLLSTNFCTVLFPRLAGDVAAGDGAALQRSLSFGLKTMVLVMGGATVLMLVLAQDVTGLLLERGRFDPAATLLTGRALAALALCLVFQGVGNVINLALYAAGRTGAVAACGVGRVALNLLFNALLMQPLGAVGIALSTSLTLGLWLLLVAWPFRNEMRRRGVGALWDASFATLVMKVAVAAGLCALVAGALAELPLLAGAGLGPRLARLLAAGGGGVAAYGLGLWLLRLPEAAAAMRLLTARLGWRGTA
jgi:putative peptidoglycan lipid II flippase